RWLSGSCGRHRALSRLPRASGRSSPARTTTPPAPSSRSPATPHAPSPSSYTITGRNSSDARTSSSPDPARRLPRPHRPRTLPAPPRFRCLGPCPPTFALFPPGGGGGGEEGPADLIGRGLRSGLAQCPERRPHLLREQLWLFPGGEVAAPFGLVEVDQVVVRALHPVARGLEQLAGEHRVGHRERKVRRRVLDCGFRTS